MAGCTPGMQRAGGVGDCHGGTGAVAFQVDFEDFTQYGEYVRQLMYEYGEDYLSTMPDIVEEGIVRGTFWLRAVTEEWEGAVGVIV